VQHAVCPQPTAHQFFIFLGFMTLCTLSAVSLAMTIAAWARTTNMAVTILPMVRAQPQGMTPCLARDHQRLCASSLCTRRYAENRQMACEHQAK
jgi:hypothetical protein